MFVIQLNCQKVLGHETYNQNLGKPQSRVKLEM